MHLDNIQLVVNIMHIKLGFFRIGPARRNVALYQHQRIPDPPVQQESTGHHQGGRRYSGEPEKRQKCRHPEPRSRHRILRHDEFFQWTGNVQP